MMSRSLDRIAKSGGEEDEVRITDLESRGEIYLNGRLSRSEEEYTIKQRVSLYDFQMRLAKPGEELSRESAGDQG